MYMYYMVLRNTRRVFYERHEHNFVQKQWSASRGKDRLHTYGTPTSYARLEPCIGTNNLHQKT